MAPIVNLGAGIALFAAAGNLTMGTLHIALARAPGWRIARLFAAIAFTAAAYNLLDVILSTTGFTANASFAAENLTYLVATVNAVFWILYAHADKHGSLHAAPRYVNWLAISAVVIGAAMTSIGWVVEPSSDSIPFPAGGVPQRLSAATSWSDAYWLFITGLGIFAFFRLAGRYQKGERALKWQVVCYFVFLACVVDQMLVASRLVNFPSLLDIGFVLAVIPLTLHTVRRISNDARRLRELSGYLKGQVERRTEERDEVRKALQETQEDLREVVSSLDEIVWEAEAQSLSISFVSAGAARLLGYPAADDRRKAFWSRYVHPDDRERLMAEAMNAVRTNQVLKLEHRMLAADGRVLWFRDSLHPVRGPLREAARLRGVMTDITESRRAQESLIESEERFRKIADAAPVLIWARDAAGQITYVNKQAFAFYGRSLDQLKGAGWIELVHIDDRERVLAQLTETLNSRHEYQMEFRQLRADGEFRWMLSTAVPRFSGIDYAGHIGTMIDITQLKRDQEQGLAAQKLESLGVLAGGVAHDFNNLLGSILADTELLLADLPSGSIARDGINRINSVAVRASEIVRELMTFAGQESPSFEPLDVSGVVREMLELLRVSISKHAVLRIDLADSLPTIMANASQLRQIVMNLILNASESLGEAGGAITVTSELFTVARDTVQRGDLSEGKYVRLTVSDTGCGMTRELQDKIFDPFFTTKFTGRGLGLAAVQGIVRGHRGAIQLTSAPGTGTRFEIFLPCSQGAALPPAGTDESEALREAPPLSGVVLVVEDEEVLRNAVCKMLRKKGFSVLEAADGHAALEVFRATSPSVGVILLDMTLPGISGRKLFEELRRIRPDVRVILTTAYSKEMAANAVGSPQAWGFIRKPYHIADLVALLQSAQIPIRQAAGGTLAPRTGPRP
jgi:PAS domain S-box-containing protein